MIDRRSKISIAAGILMAATALAMLFRQEATSILPGLPGTFDRLVLGERTETAASSGPSLGMPIPPARSWAAQPAAPSASADSSPPALVPMPQAPPPPDLPKSYPGQPHSAWGIAITRGLLQAGTTPAKPLRHKIRDGDTLAALAQRYLGSSDRAAEIYEANRDVLRNPDLLPIGVQLKIPPSSRPAQEAAPQEPARRLVPIPPRGRRDEGPILAEPK